MAQNYITISDETVIKLTVNQGLESQRTNETLGTFTIGELAYTRDTGRLFVGDNSDGEAGHRGIQETIGGSLVGNKYLGLIDSKPLATSFNNGDALSYEHDTATEKGLLTKDSKFRIHADSSADVTWDNWDRHAIYNAKYNAYNGDFMYDIYQNAFILFDTRITPANQPKVKLDEHGIPVEPETFIVDGQEISSDSPEAANIKHRSPILNYQINGRENGSNTVVYGDGYVVMRNIEPDNVTIRFRPKSFQANGLPEDGTGNYTHNLLEVCDVPMSILEKKFTDDFTFTNGIALNKNLAHIASITGQNGTIKFPNDISFATSAAKGRDGKVIMNWHLNEPPNIAAPSNKAYYLKLTPTKKYKDNRGDEVVSFKADIVPERKIQAPRYYIKLDGIQSSQPASNSLILDESATKPDSPVTLKADLSSIGTKFSSDFVVDNSIQLNKYLTDIISITPRKNASLELPANIAIAGKEDNTKPKETFFHLRFKKPNGIEAPSNEVYYLAFRPTTKTNTNNGSICTFSGEFVTKEGVELDPKFPENDYLGNYAKLNHLKTPAEIGKTTNLTEMTDVQVNFVISANKLQIFPQSDKFSANSALDVYIPDIASSILVRVDYDPAHNETMELIAGVNNYARRLMRVSSVDSRIVELPICSTWNMARRFILIMKTSQPVVLTYLAYRP